MLQLVGEGKLRLDDTVDHVLPGKLRGGEGITVHQLLQQTSGLYDYLNDPRIFRPYLKGNVRYAWTPSRLLAIANAHRPGFRAGAKWEYSNTNYLVLGLIVEAVTHNPLGVELKRRVFDRAGLQATTFDTQPTIAGRHMHGYFPLNKRLTDLSVLSPTAGWAAGASCRPPTTSPASIARCSRAGSCRADLLHEMESTVSMGSPVERIRSRPLANGDAGAVERAVRLRCGLGSQRRLDRVQHERLQQQGRHAPVRTLRQPRRGSVHAPDREGDLRPRQQGLLRRLRP